MNQLPQSEVPPVQHCYFLDKATAIAHYEKELEVDYGNGCTLRQFCYYSGSESEPMVNPETPYLVNLPTSKLIDFFRDYLAYPLPTHVELGGVAGNAQMQIMVDEILAVFAEIQQERDKRIDDALFTQPVMAEWMAKQQIKTYKFNKHISGYQLNYVIGNPIEEHKHLKNLIFLPEQKMAETVYEKSCRPPKILVPSPFDSSELLEQGQQFLRYIQGQYSNYVNQKYFKSIVKIQQKKVDFSSEQPLRVLITACYYTTVMRYALKNMALAFENQGCEVLFLIDDPYHTLIGAKVTDAFEAFSPHITFHINHLNNEYLPEETFNFIWWQDFMNILQKPDRFPKVRDRDFHFAFSDYIFEAVKSKGVEVTYQEQCADENIYSPPSDETHRREVIAFVGSAYSQEPKDFVKLYGEQALQEVFQDFEAIFHQPISEPQERGGLVHRYIEIHSQFDAQMLRRLWVYFCRKTIVYALIEQSPYPVELYGYDWHEDPITAPFYKGQIENGKELANLYRSVKYGLSVQPYMVGHQRLAEIKFCGSVPLVYWTPCYYENADYKEEVLAFETLEDLLQQLNRDIKEGSLPDKNIRFHLSYENFAKRCLEQVKASIQGS